MDLFVSRLSHQLTQYMSWKINPFSQSRDSFQMSWANTFVHALALFALIRRVLQKVDQDHCIMLIITSALPGQTCFPGFLRMSVQKLATLTGAPRSTEKSWKKVECTRNAEFTATTDMDIQRQNLFKERIPTRAFNLIINNKRTSSIKHYKSAWKKWFDWCCEREISPTRWNINHVLDFFGRIIWEGVGIKNHWESQVSDIFFPWPNWVHSSEQSPKSICPHVRYI